MYRANEKFSPGDRIGIYEILEELPVRRYRTHSFRAFLVRCTKCGARGERVYAPALEKAQRCPNCPQKHLDQYRTRDHTGERHGGLCVIGRAGEDLGEAKTLWRCHCDYCGRDTEISGHYLRTYTSCGCQSRARAEQGKQIFKSRHVGGTAIGSISPGRAPNRNNRSGHLGVCEKRVGGKSVGWCATITFKGKRYHLGLFQEIEEAISARKRAEKELFGNFLKWYEESRKGPQG